LLRKNVKSLPPNVEPLKIAAVKPLPSLVGLAFFGRLVAAVVLVNVAFVGFSNLAAQVQAPSATDVSPTVNAEVSSVINTGSGYDAWTGSARRTITDLEVPGAVGSHGLKWVRSYNSASKDNGNGGWSFSYTWRYWGRGWADPQAVVLPDGGIWRPYEPGMKLRLVRSGLSSFSTWANLYLEDGSMVYMDGYTDFPDDQHSNTVDYFYPEYVLDPYGRKTILTYEQIYVPPNYNTLNLRLVKVTDPSGRFIKITYAGSDNFTWFKVTRVEGSNGSWVNYSWPDAYHFHVDYSDGTTAAYTYGDTTYLMDTVCCPRGVCDNCTVTAHATKLITAQDTHADGPMQSIQYEYKSPGAFEGQIRAEHHYPSNTLVSQFTSTSCPTHPWSTSPDCPTATQTETRGDGPSRTIYMAQATQHVPLVKRKSDFNGVNEVFTYDSNNYLLTAKDRNGYTTTYTNESVIGNPTRITHPDGTHIDYTYSDSANPYYISTVTDELARTITYTRDPTTHLITRIDYPDGAYETFAYNGFGQVLTHRRKNGAFDYAAYDSTGLLIKLWNPTTAASVTDTDPHITLAYYPAGNAWQDRVSTVTYPANSSGLIASETYEYDRDSSGNPVHGRGLVTKITHADGTAKTFAYDSFGNKTSETDETGNTTTYTYDDYKRVKTAKNALNQTTTNDYTATNGASAYSHTTNSVRKSTSPTGIVTGQTYDNNFRLASRIEAEGSAIAATTTFGYDNNGNKTSMTDPLGHATTTTYDNRNRKKTLTDALSHVTTWNYDTTSNVTSINRPDGTTETKTYDTMHRVLTDTVPQTSTINLITTFVYNLSGTLQKVTDPKAQATTFAYDAADLKTKMTYLATGEYQAWTYDNAKNLISRRTVNGVTQNFTYDNRNRKKTMTWSNGLDSASFGYDGASRLTSASNPTSTITRAYDAAGRLTLDEQSVTGLGIKM
jgi:YD repeat-containing protein